MVKASKAVAKRPLRRAVGYASAGGLLVSLAFSCAASDEMQAPPEVRPANSAERARARDERSARARAREEQPAKDPRAKREVPPPPPPAPSAKPTASAEATERDAGSDAASADAGVDAAEVDASLPPLCATVCERAVGCFKSDMLEEIGDSEIRARMQESMEEGRKECVEECDKKRSERGEDYERDVRACMEDSECESFLACIRALRE